MTAIAKTALTLIAAAALSVLLLWAPTGLLAPAFATDFPTVLEVMGLAADVGAKILPGLLVGAAVAHRPVILGGLVSGAAASLYFSQVFSATPLGFGPLQLLLWFSEYFVYGLAGAACGLLMRARPNNSFKPKPLRGSA